MRVLVGVDGSDSAFEAVEFVGSLLSAQRDELRLYFSVPSIHLQVAEGAGATSLKLKECLAQAVFERAKRRLPIDLASKAGTVAGTHDPRAGLLIASDEWRADLIAIGARGTGPLKQATLGSVARQLAHHATLPLLVVRNAPPTVNAVSILLASDGSDASLHAANQLEKFSWPRGTIGRVVTVLESLTPGETPEWLLEELDDQQFTELGMGRFLRSDEEETRLRQELGSWYGRLPEIFQGRDPLVATGHPGEEILRAASSFHANVIIVGARRQGVLHRAILGSTSEQVLAHAPCSVLLVPAEQAP